jgi:hypothetical protein
LITKFFLGAEARVLLLSPMADAYGYYRCGGFGLERTTTTLFQFFQWAIGRQKINHQTSYFNKVPTNNMGILKTPPFVALLYSKRDAAMATGTPLAY